MRHGIVATGALVVAFSVGGWVAGPAPVAESTPPAIVSAGPPEMLDATPTSTARPDPAPVVSTTTSPDPTVDAADEFLHRLNDLRRGEGRAALTRRAPLDELAQSWVETIASEGALRHSRLIYDVIAGPWTRSGENVGYGPTVEDIFAALDASPSHRANMVDADYTSVGIGIVRVDGVVWTAHLFAG